MNDPLDDVWYPSDAELDRETAPRKCARHRWQGEACARCGKPKDEARSRRGRTSRNRGNAFEREVAAILGGRRVGQFGDKVDVEVAGWLRIQCKNGAAYPALLDRWLRAIPVQADLLRAVVVGDAPGAGTRRRSLIVLDLGEFSAWYAKGGNTDDPNP